MVSCPSLAFVNDHDVDHPVVVHTENIYIEAYIHQHLNTFLLFVPTLIAIYNHTLNLNTSQKKFLKWGVWFKSPNITFINLLIWPDI